MTKQRIALNPFVERQTAESPYTHWNISDVRLVELAEAELHAGRISPGYRPGVVLVHVDPAGFHTGVIQLQQGDKLVGEFASRREGEHPRKHVYADSTSSKLPAKSVEVVLYAHDVLAENGDAATNADYEIVSVNGNPTDGPAPIHPNTLCHNHFDSDGGTETKMTAQQFESALQESFLFWKDKALLK